MKNDDAYIDDLVDFDAENDDSAAADMSPKTSEWYAEQTTNIYGVLQDLRRRVRIATKPYVDKSHAGTHARISLLDDALKSGMMDEGFAHFLGDMIKAQVDEDYSSMPSFGPFNIEGVLKPRGEKYLNTTWEGLTDASYDLLQLARINELEALTGKSQQSDWDLPPVRKLVKTLPYHLGQAIDGLYHHIESHYEDATVIKSKSSQLRMRVEEQLQKNNLNEKLREYLHETFYASPEASLLVSGLRNPTTHGRPSHYFGISPNGVQGIGFVDKRFPALPQESVYDMMFGLYAYVASGIAKAVELLYADGKVGYGRKQ